MKHVLAPALILVMSVAAAACDDSPTDPSDETITFTAQLSPANEVPAVTNAEASGSGTATIRFDVDRNSSGAITAVTVDFQVTLTGFPSSTPVNMAHIHTGVAGATGGILVDTGLTPGEVTLGNGAGNFTKNGVALQGDALAAAQNIISNPGNYYFNVHSTLNPAGMARGQLVRQ
jgi:hypothetical protein